jgi:hypothetical protein
MAWQIHIERPGFFLMGSLVAYLHSIVSSGSRLLRRGLGAVA